MRFTPLLAALCLCATPTLAQEATEEAATADAPAITDCRSLIDLGTLLVGDADTGVEDLADGCRFTNVYIQTDTIVRWLVGEFEITGRDVLDSLAAERLPERLIVSLAGMHFAPDHGGPAMAYISRNQAPPFSIHLDYAWDRQSQILTVEHFGMRSFGGHVTLSGEIGDIAALPATVEELVDLPGASFRNLTVKLDNQGLFESFFMPALVMALSRDGDPRETILPLQQQLKGFIYALPVGVINHEGRLAMMDFVDAFPHPSGQYEMTLTAREPISQADIMAAGSEASAITLLAERLQMTALHIDGTSPYTSGNP